MGWPAAGGRLDELGKNRRHGRGQRGGPEALGFEAANLDHCARQRLIVAMAFLPELERRPAQPDEMAADPQDVIKLGWCLETGVGATHDKQTIVIVDHGLLAETEGAQPFGTRAFEKPEVIGVVHHTAGIGVFVVDPDRKLERRWQGAAGGRHGGPENRTN